ncbi:TRAP-type C4-dicarboxylate transport system permease small subunit [Anoxybacillus vitaminiphilus]|uniref:TRAP-type C4-dicarboxylate transport system permease small subunit n=1 Tax=Paranoxybacillus vitaminiphilus TaxID=581036 RepID=A0A327YLS9_9BACL|nr:TRAP transporter small permease [Anoxybacillus vitaminiphilus]RAK22024.1 TRAP-type C4-dicarboxylate transport system permease small subunit [Anoxybacillus vitaminiphilus]
MKKIVLMLDKLLHVLMALCLAFMAILVFGNVVLRYAFHSGITWSEEMSRFLFIWMIFLGAIGALKDNDHLGVDTLLKKLPLSAKRVVFILSNLIVLYVLWLVLDGSWKITMTNMHSTAPATGLPIAYVYGIGIVMSIGMGIIVLFNTYRALFRTDTIEELTRMKESEEEIMEAVHEEIMESHHGQKRDAVGGER